MALIERETAIAKKVYCEERHEYVVPVAELDRQLTIDAAPVVHGRWIADCTDAGRVMGYFCSECGTSLDSHPRMRYCPNCGARMDGGVEKRMPDPPSLEGALDVTLQRFLTVV